MDKKKFVLELARKFKERVRFVDVKKIILFGSYARGDYGEWSDVDMIVVSDDFGGMKKVDRPVVLYDDWTSDYPVDFLCYTSEEFDRLKGGISIVGQAVKEGVEI